MRLTSARQIPAKVQKHADAQQLGTPRILYETGPTTHLHLFVAPLTFLVGAAILVAYYFLYDSIFSWWPAEQAYLVLFIAFAWIGIGLWILLPPLFAPPLRIFLCPKGLISIKRGIQVIRWDRMTHFWKVVTVHHRTGMSCSYYIRRSDGRLFLLTPDLPYVDRLAGFLEREIARQLLPGVITAYENGSAQDFADLIITNTGIGIKSRRLLLPWSEVAGLNVDTTTLSIRRKGDEWDWATVSLSGLPNVGVLRGLVEHILHATPGSPEIAAYKAGLSVFQGTLCINKVGVSISNHEEVVPWNEIASFGIGESEVIIRRKGQVNEWYTVPIRLIPDVEALKKLIEHILQEQPG